MSEFNSPGAITEHSHVFLGTGHEQNERKTWAVIVLCGVMMLHSLSAILVGTKATF